MRLAIITIAVLSVLNLNIQQPILEPNRVAKSDEIVATFVNTDVVYHTPEFVDMKPINAIAEDKLKDAENKRIATEAARLQAQAVNTSQTTKNVPSIAQSSSNDVFIQLSYCEAGGDPTKNTGNGYYGMFQYDLQTWGNYMGYARPDLAPADVQLAKARETQARRGWSPWPSCARKLVYCNGRS
jgi:Transglycosylase-like domain.